MMCCIPRLTMVMPTQQHPPRISGFPPDLINFTTLLLSPIAAIAIMIKNFDNSFNGANTSALTPKVMHTVVITAAMMKYKMNIGNALFRLNLFDGRSALLEFAADFARIIDKIRVIGIIASVRVSFTVTAVFSVSLPRFHMLSQVEAAAVTEEVSLIAVPANNPKGSPLVVSNPSALPKTGKSTAAITLKKKMTEIACATSVSSASMTGAVAAIAEPPQMDEPTPTRIEVLDGTFMILRSNHAIIREVLMVQMMMGRDCFPVCRITPRFIPNPSRTTAVCKMILEVHLIPDSAFPLLTHTNVMSIPTRIAMTGPPTTGKAFPRSQDGTAMTKHTRIPIKFF